MEELRQLAPVPAPVLVVQDVVAVVEGELVLETVHAIVPQIRTSKMFQ